MYLGPAGTCWATSQAAAHAICTDMGKAPGSSSSAYCLSVSQTGSSATLTIRSQGQFGTLGTWTETRPIYACDPARTNPFFLSNQEGALLASAVVAIWASAWGFRVLRRTLDDGDK